MSEYKGSINNEEVGRRMKEIREAHNLTQEQMAEILKVTTNAVRDYEKGNYGVSKDVMLRLKQYFNVSIDYLLFGDNTEKEKLLFLLDNASEESKMKAFMYLLTYYMLAKKKGSMKDVDLNLAMESFKELFEEIH